MTIPAPQADILALLGDEPLSDSQILQLYKLARDQLIFAIHNAEAVTYLEIRNRRVQVSDPRALLELLEQKLIPMYSEAVSAASGSQRTIAKLMRR